MAKAILRERRYQFLDGGLDDRQMFIVSGGNAKSTLKDIDLLLVLRFEQRDQVFSIHRGIFRV